MLFRACSLAAALTFPSLVCLAPVAIRDRACARPASQELNAAGIRQALPGPGAYLDTVTGSPRFVRVAGVVPKALDVRLRGKAEPVWIRVPGGTSTLRTGSRPTFYFDGIEHVIVGKPDAYRCGLSLAVAEVEKDVRRVYWGTSQVRGAQIVAKPDDSRQIAVTLELLDDSLCRLAPSAPLQPGEYVIWPFRTGGEVAVTIAMNMRYTPQAEVYGFGVDAASRPTP
jgi:hypothetical protein